MSQQTLPLEIELQNVAGRFRVSSLFAATEFIDKVFGAWCLARYQDGVLLMYRHHELVAKITKIASP